MRGECRESWHVFDFVGDTDSLTCHCGARTMAVARMGKETPMERPLPEPEPEPEPDEVPEPVK